MQELTHYLNGAHVKGTSGRFADVYNPATGEVQAKVPLAGEAELDQAVKYAMAAQPAWAAVNPQRRARVMMKFVDLLNRDMDKLAEALSREHGKTLPDAAGDVQRGLEVVEYCIGAPELLKGDFTDSAGPGIDMYSMRQPLGVSAGITPFNFPAMIPMWMFAPAIVCGNAFILKPSERDPSVPLMLAELLEEAGYDGTPIVLMAPTDVISLNNQPVVAAQALREAGFEVDMQSMDWQSVVQRRAQQSPVAEGGWNLFFTNWMVPEVSDPLVNVMLNGRGDDGWFGWPDAPEIEAMRTEYVSASDDATKKEIATRIQEHVMDNVNYLMMGEYIIPQARRSNIEDMIPSPVPVFWNMTKAAE